MKRHSGLQQRVCRRLEKAFPCSLRCEFAIRQRCALTAHTDHLHLALIILPICAKHDWPAEHQIVEELKVNVRVTDKSERERSAVLQCRMPALWQQLSPNSSFAIRAEKKTIYRPDLILWPCLGHPCTTPPLCTPPFSGDTTWRHAHSQLRILVHQTSSLPCYWKQLQCAQRWTRP